MTENVCGTYTQLEGKMICKFFYNVFNNITKNITSNINVYFVIFPLILTNINSEFIDTGVIEPCIANHHTQCILQIVKIY